MAFLESLLGGINAAGQAAGGVAAVGNLFGIGKDRPSWRDMQFMMDTSERLSDRDIALQGKYLEGLAPAQAGAYNTYQDATYAADSQRQIDRIKSTGEQLGMSPWEIMGQGGAAPLPSPSFGGSGQTPAKGDYLRELTPLVVTNMNNKTALATAALNALGQKYAVDKTTEATIYGTDTNAATSRYTVDQTQGLSPLAQKHIAELQSRIELQDWQKANQMQDLDVKNQQMMLNIMRIAIDASPKDTFSIPGLTTTQPAIWKQIFGVLRNTNSDQLGWERAGSDLVNKLPPDEFNDLKRWTLGNAKNIGNDIDAFFGGARKWLGGPGPQQTMDSITEWLQGIVKQAQDAGAGPGAFENRIDR